jgi:hypothetical protein
MAPQISGTLAPVCRQNTFVPGSKLTQRRCIR